MILQLLIDTLLLGVGLLLSFRFLILCGRHAALDLCQIPLCSTGCALRSSEVGVPPAVKVAQMRQSDAHGSSPDLLFDGYEHFLLVRLVFDQLTVGSSIALDPDIHSVSLIRR